MRDVVSSENSEVFSASSPPSRFGATLTPGLLLGVLAGDEETMSSRSWVLIVLAAASSDILLKMIGVVDAVEMSLLAVYTVW
jgi:hypothetical protein